MKTVIFILASLLASTHSHPTHAITKKFSKQESCPAKCGVNAECQFDNLEQPCSGKSGFSGDPFIYCYPFGPNGPTHAITKKFSKQESCPAKCGVNAECRFDNLE